MIKLLVFIVFSSAAYCQVTKIERIFQIFIKLKDNLILKITERHRHVQSRM